MPALLSCSPWPLKLLANLADERESCGQRNSCPSNPLSFSITPPALTVRGASQDITGPLTTRSTLRTFATVSVVSSAGCGCLLGPGDAGEGVLRDWAERCFFLAQGVQHLKRCGCVSGSCCSWHCPWERVCVCSIHEIRSGGTF